MIDNNPTLAIVGELEGVYSHLKIQIQSVQKDEGKSLCERVIK
jgi:hypothetical protein